MKILKCSICNETFIVDNTDNFMVNHIAKFHLKEVENKQNELEALFNLEFKKWVISKFS